MATRVL
jgi:hypothetical protein